MKANAPEKIYLRHNHKGDIGAGWLIFPLTNNDIEYTRTNAFIEKAIEYIIDMHTVGIYGTKTNECIIENFRKYMKGE